MALSLVASGCGGSSGPELAAVTGVVKLDGAPLADARVEFIPKDGRPAVALTDASGAYELTYNADRNGATPGEYTVRVSTYRRGDESGTGKTPERVPTKYNTKSELKKTVEPGKNEINIDLESSGKVVQPAETD
jgi:hypothetical protein